MNANVMPSVEQADWKRQIEDVEERHRRAFLAQDLEALRRLWADELLVNTPLNRVDGKATLLDLLSRGVISHSGFEVTIETMTRFGDTVVVMGSEAVTNGAGSAPFGRRFTNVWRAAGGSWQLVARHAHLSDTA